MPHRLTAFLPLVLVFPLSSCAAESPAPQDPPPSEFKLEIKETPLGPWPLPPSSENSSTSPDQKRNLFTLEKDGKQLVVVDGKEGPKFDAILGSPVFTSDSQHIYYRAKRDGQQFFVVDDDVGKGYDASEDDWYFVSPDCKRFGFIAHRGNQGMMVIDRAEGKLYHRVERESPTFSPDSKRYLYVVETDEKKKVLVVDGVEGKPYDSIYHPQFSPDSQHVIYEAVRLTNPGVDSFVVVDGVEGPVFAPGIFNLEFSPDSKRVAYRATPNGKLARYVMVVDGVAGKEYDGIEVYTRAFSQDSKHVSYTAEIGKKKCVVVDGQEGPLCDYIEYTGPEDGHVSYLAVRNGQAAIISDGKEVAKLNSPKWCFSPDYQHLAYLAADKDGWWIVRDGKEGAHHTVGEPWRTLLRWSPDSQHFAYHAAQRKPGYLDFVVVDGVQSIYYQMVATYSPHFGPDSKHFAYWACPASGKWHLFIDKSYSGPYDEVNATGDFDGPDTFHAVAVRDGQLFRLEVTIPAQGKQ